MDENNVLSGLEPDELMARAMISEVSIAFSEWTLPKVEDVEKIVTGYEVKNILGRGGMGAVYQVYQPELDRLCALKLLPLEVSSVAGFEERFIQEARAMAKLDHPNIITIHDFGRSSEGHLFYVMEYVEGLDLAALIKSGSLSVEKALDIISQICDALEYAHEAGYVHRDIKPANILIDKTGIAKVTDFGLAKLLSSKKNAGVTMTGQVMGTPDYMAPEQSQGLEIDHRADIFALGVMLYELLTGSLPKGVFSPPSEQLHLNQKFDEVVIKAMQQKPELRYQHMSEVKSSLKQASDSLTAIGDSNKNKKLLYICAVLCLCAIVAVIIIIAPFNSDNISQEKPYVDSSTWPDPNGVYLNTQQRKFIPIEETNVLFSETETTVHDWSTFLLATNYKWKGDTGIVPTKSSRELPVTLISWHDANAYCKWLTDTERQAGRIGPEMEYRLPTDEEWSRAAGLKDESVESSYLERFKKRSFRGMQRPIPQWLETTTPNEPQWNPSDLSGSNGEIFPWGNQWPPENNQTVAYADRTYQAYPQYQSYQKILGKPLDQVHWGADSSDLLDLYRSNFGQDWATDLTTFGPMALTRVAWIYKQGKARLVYHDGFTYCLIEPLMRLRQACLLEEWLEAELAYFKTPESMQDFIKEYPHGDWSSGVAIGGRYQMDGEYKLPEWQEWQGFYTDPDSSPGRWVWSNNESEITSEWWQSESAPKPSFLFETALALKKNGFLEPINRHANLPLLLRWKGKKTPKEIEQLCENIYQKQVKAILAEFEDTMNHFVKPQMLSTSKKNASSVEVNNAKLSQNNLRGLSGNVSEWVEDSMTNPNNDKPIIAWTRGASWKLTGGHRAQLLSSHRNSNFCTERSDLVGFRPVLGFTSSEKPSYLPELRKNNYYAIITVSQDWQTAAKLCSATKGYLLSLESKEEEDWIKKRFVDYGNIFLGASRIVGEDSRVKRSGSWTWESGNPFIYFPKRIPHNFSDTEPVLRMALDRDGWYDYSDKNKSRFIIEWEQSTSP